MPIVKLDRMSCQEFIFRVSLFSRIGPTIALSSYLEACIYGRVLPIPHLIRDHDEKMPILTRILRDLGPDEEKPLILCQDFETGAKISQGLNRLSGIKSAFVNEKLEGSLAIENVLYYWNNLETESGMSLSVRGSSIAPIDIRLLEFAKYCHIPIYLRTGLNQFNY